jgi:hypothetical protein
MNNHIPPGRDGLDLTQTNGSIFRAAAIQLSTQCPLLGAKRTLQTKAAETLQVSRESVSFTDMKTE